MLVLSLNFKNKNEAEYGRLLMVLILVFLLNK